MNKLKLFKEIMYSFFNIINKDNKYEKYYSINNNNGYDILKKHFIYVYENEKYSANVYYYYYIWLTILVKI